MEDDPVIIAVYHVVDQEDVHRFIATNGRFVKHVGGLDALGHRLRQEFREFTLIGTRPFNEAAEDGLGVEIRERIRSIVHEHPNCDPLPQPWSEGELRKDRARSIADSLGCSSDFERKITYDLLQIQESTGDIALLKRK
jgi:hypothetical protein